MTCNPSKPRPLPFRAFRRWVIRAGVNRYCGSYFCESKRLESGTWSAERFDATRYINYLDAVVKLGEIAARGGTARVVQIVVHHRERIRHVA